MEESRKKRLSRIIVELTEICTELAQDAEREGISDKQQQEYIDISEIVYDARDVLDEVADSNLV